MLYDDFAKVPYPPLATQEADNLVLAAKSITQVIFQTPSLPAFIVL